MARFHFRFGYQTPPQLYRWNDDEDSELIVIEAGSEEAAMAWGCEIAQRFMGLMFEQAVDWKQIGYAHWIEPADPDSAPVVEVGTFPDFEQVLSKYSEEERRGWKKYK